MTFQCKVCGKLKARIQAPIEKKISRYLDDKGRAWNGRQCPSCAYQLRKVAKGKFNKNFKKQLNALGPELTIKMTNRLCKVCSHLLPESSYYWHEQCRPVSYYQDDFITYTLYG